jgi:NAD(P)H-dependent FMN reductase
MNESLKFLGIPGSLRRSSYNRATLVAAQSLLPAGVSLEVFNLEGIPLFNQDMETLNNKERSRRYARPTRSCSLPRNTTIPYPVC